MADHLSEWDFADVILAVLFGLTLEVALEVGLKPFVGFADVTAFKTAVLQDLGRHAGLFVQLLVFIATLCRFYGGAHRFHSEQPEARGSWWDLAVDAAWTPTLFLGFYTAALLVTTHDLFLAAVAAFHVIDFVWFAVVLRATNCPRFMKVLLGKYLWYDAVTVAAACLALAALWNERLTPAQLPWVTSIILAGMFFVDVFGPTREWYFAPEKWRADHA